ncbi:MAG TPA: efflux RND transporter periplasmic adaptor subunit [Oculatellaceae cyanobacterium]
MQAPEDTSISKESADPAKQRRAWLLTLAAIAIVVVLSAVLWFAIANRTSHESEKRAKPEEEGARQSVELNQATTKINVREIGQETPTPVITVTGTVEPNQQKVQEISSLTAGRVEDVKVALGDHVSPGMVLIVMQSPQVAEMHGKLHEAETKLELAQLTLTRAKQAANKVAILKAKASLDEAQSTLKRTNQLVSEGLTARKDLVAAQSDFERAQAEYNFQKNISFNREIADATAAVKTGETEEKHIRDSLKALNAQLPSKTDGAEHDISSLVLRSPISGVVIDRSVNPGTGVEAGKPLMTIANTSTLWVIANVPENEMRHVRLGMPARILLDGRVINGNVSFIDPRLNEDTRTSRVRIVVNNPDNRIQAGSFVQIELMRPVDQTVFYVPSTAVQQVDGNSVVFVQDKSGLFTVRKVDAGDETQGLVPVKRGIAIGDRIAVEGSFVLKSKLLKGQLGDED